MFRPKIKIGSSLTVGKYKVHVINFLSQGGFADVYKVRISPTYNMIDIACLKKVIVSNKMYLNQLLKEIETLKMLRNCKHIVKYYDSSYEVLPNFEYHFFFLMEFCANKSLLDYINVKNDVFLTEHEVLKIIYQISKGVLELHLFDLIHRDIKVENILVDINNNFKLCDFGSASSINNTRGKNNEINNLFSEIMTFTTLEYRCPEMLELSMGYSIGKKSDIWALGCLFFKLCYSKLPFDSIDQITNSDLHFPESPKYTEQLKNLIVLMLQKSPENRTSIIEVIEMIRKIILCNENDNFFQKTETDYLFPDINVHDIESVSVNNDYYKNLKKEIVVEKKKNLSSSNSIFLDYKIYQKLFNRSLRKRQFTFLKSMLLSSDKCKSDYNEKKNLLLDKIQWFSHTNQTKQILSLKTKFFENTSCPSKFNEKNELFSNSKKKSNYKFLLHKIKLNIIRIINLIILNFRCFFSHSNKSKMMS